MAKQTKRIDNECVFEIKYKPNAKLLDHRGKWAEDISQKMHLEHWQIVENRIDVFSEDRETLVFFGYKNSGISLSNVPNKEFFYNFTKTLLTYVMGFENFGDPIRIDRIGVRTKFCTPFDGTFEKLCERYATRYINITEKAKDAIGADAKLVDIGAPLDFEDSVGSFKTVSGPMLQSQFSTVFTNSGEFPQVGIYYDIDYSVRPKKDLGSQAIIETICNLYAAGWDRHARVRNLLLKG